MNKFSKRKPILFGGLTTAARYLIGDSIVQVGASLSLSPSLSLLPSRTHAHPFTPICPRMASLLGVSAVHSHLDTPRNHFQAMSEDPGWDFQRTLLFTLFGFVYASTAGYTVYNLIYPRLFGSSRPYMTAFLDVCSQTPFFYFPTFYIARSFAFTPIPDWIEVRPPPIGVLIGVLLVR